jgi:thioredoxin reductase (NADPH)
MDGPPDRPYPASYTRAERPAPHIRVCYNSESTISGLHLNLHSAYKQRRELNRFAKRALMKASVTTNLFGVIVIGAGPTGLACAIEAKRAGLRPLVIDKGCLCNSLYHYPTNMQFFTTPERMEIGDIPMTISDTKPTRVEALKYYRKTVEHYGIETRLYERVDRTEGRDGNFTVHTMDEYETLHQYHGRKIIIATGYYDLPNRLGVPGEDLPHVSHYFTDPHPYWQKDVVVIGGKNSAAEAALDLFRGGARVTLVHRGTEMGKSLKYWVKPDIENRIRAGEVTALFKTHVVCFEPGKVIVKNSGAERALPAEHAFAMTGYHPDFTFLEQQGIRLDPETRRPASNPETLETNVPGIHIAGVVVGGMNTSEIFIENGRFHGKEIIAAITGKGRITEAPPVAPPGE